MTRLSALAAALGAFAIICPPTALAQRPPEDASTFAAYLSTGHQITPDITYLTASGVDLKLDVYRPRGASAPLPTVLLFHGGGYRMQSTKEGFALSAIPWLQMGWNAVNVEYRPSEVALAPAAVEDVRCALRWVAQNAKEYGVDTNRIVLTGNSAGGHLALIAGMLPESAGLDRRCPGRDPVKVAAIVDWYGITDYTALIDDMTRGYAVTWFGPQLNRMELARLVSPIAHVRPGLPPTFLVHGDADPTVPYDQAVRLHDALRKAGVATEFYTVPGGKHGNFPREHVLRAWNAIAAFLVKNNVVSASPRS